MAPQTPPTHNAGRLYQCGAIAAGVVLAVSLRLLTADHNEPFLNVLLGFLVGAGLGGALTYVLLFRRWVAASVIAVLPLSLAVLFPSTSQGPVLPNQGVDDLSGNFPSSSPTNAPPSTSGGAVTQPSAQAEGATRRDKAQAAAESKSRARKAARAEAEAKARARETARSAQRLQQYSKQLVDGVVGFDYPSRMKVGDHTDVSLRVSVLKAVQELRDSITRDGRDPIVEPVKLSSRMKAELRGFGFEVKPLSSIEQFVDAIDDTRWTWDVRALEAGKQRLTATLTAVVAMDGTEGARDVSTFYREVEVEAIPKTWWQSTQGVAREYGPSRDVIWPAIGTGIAAAWAYLFARRKARDKRARKSRQ